MYIHIAPKEMKEAWEKKMKLVEMYGERGLRMGVLTSQTKNKDNADNPNTNWGNVTGGGRIDMESLK